MKRQELTVQIASNNFLYVIFPILKSMTATVAILSFMWTWNDFTMPLIMLSDPAQQTLQLAQYVFKSQFSVDYNLAFASYTMVLIPILLLYVFWPTVDYERSGNREY